MTGASDGSINIWNTALKLHRVGMHNVKEQLHYEELINEQTMSQLLDE